MFSQNELMHLYVVKMEKNYKNIKNFKKEILKNCQNKKEKRLKNKNKFIK